MGSAGLQTLLHPVFIWFLGTQTQVGLLGLFREQINVTSQPCLGQAAHRLSVCCSIEDLSSVSSTQVTTTCNSSSTRSQPLLDAHTSQSRAGSRELLLLASPWNRGKSWAYGRTWGPVALQRADAPVFPHGAPEPARQPLTEAS